MASERNRALADLAALVRRHPGLRSVLAGPDEPQEKLRAARMLEGGALRGGMPVYKFVANKALTAIENRSFGMRLAEYHSGYLVYSRRVLDEVPFERLSDSFDFDIEMMICGQVLGLRIKEIAIPTIYADEISHLKPVRYGLDVLKIVRKYRRGYYHLVLREAS